MSDSPINDLDQKFRELPAVLARCRDARARTELSLLRLAAVSILEANEQPPAERNLGLVRMAYDQLVELRGRVAHEPWYTETDILAEPLTTVEELIDMAREMIGEHNQP